MICPECRKTEMSVNMETIRYEESGLPNVVLKNIAVKRCHECGNMMVSIPALSGLHKAIATHLVEYPNRLSAGEIRFLRKYMGWSKKDFAHKFHVRPEQVSRWESENNALLMNKQSELLLRSLVASGNKIEHYEETMDKLSLKPQEKPSILSMIFDTSWHDGLIPGFNY